jgi:hypothetical protein
VERPERIAAHDRSFGRLCRLARVVEPENDQRIDLGIVSLNARDGGIDHLDR